MKNIAYFISSHGFGHASRACAVMNELEKSGDYHFTLFTEVPQWFFMDSLNFEFNYKIYKSDVGLIQDDPFNENLSATIIALEKRFPVSINELVELSNSFSQLKIDLVICDISPVGILAADAVSIPSLLIENFTWDWIYDAYQEHRSEFTKFSFYLNNVFNKATFHLQTDPVCNRITKFPLLNPIFREPTQFRANIRNELGIGEKEVFVLITMGGIPFNIPDSLSLSKYKGMRIVIPGSNIDKEMNFKNILFLPHHHRYYHPNLVQASDIVIGKIGYSTIAETYSAGLPFLYISRNSFRESPYLEEFVQERMVGEEIGRDFLDNENWLDVVMEFIRRPKIISPVVNGAKEVSEFIKNNILFP